MSVKHEFLTKAQNAFLEEYIKKQGKMKPTRNRRKHLRNIRLKCADILSSNPNQSSAQEILIILTKLH